jgi:hypothetical protein
MDALFFMPGREAIHFGNRGLPGWNNNCKDALESTANTCETGISFTERYSGITMIVWKKIRSDVFFFQGEEGR